MANWAPVAIYPLGLAAIGLVLIYYIFRDKWKRRNRWFVGLVVIVIAAALYLGYLQLQNIPIPHSGEKKPGPTSQEPKGQLSPKTELPSSVHQETHGSGSHAVQGVTGNVTIQQGAEKEKK